MTDFSTLEQIFQMTSPSDLAGMVKLNLGGPSETFNAQFKVLADALENDGRGVLTTEDLKAKLEEIASKGTDITNNDLNLFFDFYSTKGFLSFANPAIKKYPSKDGVKSINDIKEVLGKKFDGLPSDFDVALLLSRSPFFHPAKRHTRRIETFLNSMPSLVLSQMVPYLDVEFQFARDPSPQVQTMGQLKFLLGAPDKHQLDGANKAMLEGTQVTKNGSELDFAGMEMFTSPQTLVNPTPNAKVGVGGARYSDIIDPFRPFASLETATISVTPAVGIYTYKKANLTIKLHDRSRLAEISDLIRPKSYSNVTIWLTYGWRAPKNTNNPYFEYVNNNLLMREAYGIINSNFSFDQVGQVTINLELFTKGLSEMRTLKITDTFGDAQKVVDDIRRLADEIASYRKRLKLDPPEGINREIRAFQILDAAQVGEFPDMKTSEVEQAIASLRDGLKRRKDIDTDAAKGLLNALQTFYKKDQSQSKFSLKQRIQTTATKTIKDKFDELLFGPDPFLPHNVKGKGASKEEDPLVNEINKYMRDPKTKVKDFHKQVVSFGKLFSVFALQSIVSADIVDEVQVFFYALNEQCGPVSSHSLAEFPIDMATFLDQYRDHIVHRGGERITLEEFLQLVINAQVLDNRAIGYGLRTFYEPYDPKNKDAQVVKDKERQFESALAAQTSKYGPFKKPAIEMYVETSHQRSVTEGDSDLLLQLAYSAKDASSKLDKDVQNNKLKRIMRIHIYDKQVNPYRAAAQLLKSESGKSFIEVPSTDYAKQFVADKQLGDGFFQQGVFQGIQQDATAGRVKLAEFTNQRQVKDAVSKMVPSITFGANGTTIITANLSSKNEPLLSTVNMLRSNTVKNVVGPNGSGEGGIPLRVIPATLNMTTLGCPLATMAQMYFIDFQTGTSLDNLYICTGLTHTLAQGKFETNWTFGYSDAYGIFEGSPNVIDLIRSISPDVPKKG